MKKLITILFFTISFSSFADFTPIAARYDGAGGIYGAAYTTEFDGNYRLMLGGVTGDANAFGALVTKYLTSDLEVSLGAATFSGVSLLTTYNRNLTRDDDDQYVLNMNGLVYGLGSKYWLFSDLLTLNVSATKSTVVLDSYSNEFGEKIDFGDANLFDIETLQAKVGLDINFYDNARAATKGVGLNMSVTNVSGRTGQSDQKLLDYGFKGIIPIAEHFSFILKGQYSDALVEINKKYDTDAEVRDALGANCGSIANLVDRAECEKLENDLVAYILQNNLRGTATPLGGSSGLRSFRELRFKAAHTAVYSTEFKSNLSSLFNILKSEDSNLSLVIFYDLGYANDDKLKLTDVSKFSNGAALQFSKGSNAIRLQAAAGSDDSNSWSLNFGKAL